VVTRKFFYVFLKIDLVISVFSPEMFEGVGEGMVIGWSRCKKWKI